MADSGGLFGTNQSYNPQTDAYQYLTQKGYTPVQAAGILGSLKGETANLNTTQSHDHGVGYGIAGWNGQRLQGLRAEAARTGKPISDLHLQLDYLDKELHTTELGAMNSLQQAQTPQQAAAAMVTYERPKDPHQPQRGVYAQQFYNQFGGGTTSPGQTPPGGDQAPLPQVSLAGQGGIANPVAPQTTPPAPPEQTAAAQPALASPLVGGPVTPQIQQGAQLTPQQAQYYLARTNQQRAFSKIPLPLGFQGYTG